MVAIPATMVVMPELGLETKTAATRSYQSLVAAQCQQQPYLQNLSNFLSQSSPCRHPGRISRLEFYADGLPRHSSLGRGDLAKLLLDPESGTMLGQILILEDLDRDTVEILGSCLKIDPLFFASHLRTSRAEQSCRIPVARTLPSRVKNSDFIHLPYQRPLEIHGSAASYRLRCDSNVRRKVRISHALKGTHVGFAQQCISVLARVKKGESWLSEKHRSQY